MKPPIRKPFACRNCRCPIYWSSATGWIHGSLPQYAHEDVTCDRAHPVCTHSTCDHMDGPEPDCPCRCHQ